MRSFGPQVTIDPITKKAREVHCNWCVFRTFRLGQHACSHADRSNPRIMETPNTTPDWCEMKAGMIRDAEDMASGVKHYVVRWSGRKTDEPREIYEGIPSEAELQFKLTARKAKQGTVELQTTTGKVLAKWPPQGEKDA